MTQATQNTRIEPTTGNFGVAVTDKQGKSFFAGIGLGFSKAQASHTDVLNNALQFANDALAKLDEAHAIVESQIEDHRQQAEFHQNKAVEAGTSLSRLSRVKARFTDLLA